MLKKFFRLSKNVPVHYQSCKTRCFGVSSKKNFKVAVLGAGGGIGQPLSMLLKINRSVTELVLYDISHTAGIAADLSHIETPAKVTSFSGPGKLCDALKCVNIIMISAGLPRKPSMSRDDLFIKNATIVKSVMEAIARTSPKAFIGIITNPVNSMVPIACEVFRKSKLETNNIFGVTTLDIVRANTFVAAEANLSPLEVDVPVIGGHSGNTIIPILSRATPKVCLLDKQIEALTVKIQEAGTEVVKAKAGAGSATLSMAYAASRFTNSLLRGLSGDSVVEAAYIKSDVAKVPYFSTPLKLGKCGIEANMGIGELSLFEKKLLEKALPELKKNIDSGVNFVKTT